MLKEQVKNSATQMKDVVVETAKVMGNVAAIAVKKPFWPTLIGVSWGLKKYASISGITNFAISITAAYTTEYVADEVTKRLRNKANRKAYEELRKTVTVQQDTKESMVNSTAEVIADMQTPLTMEEQYEAAIDAALISKE